MTPPLKGQAIISRLRYSVPSSQPLFPFFRQRPASHHHPHLRQQPAFHQQQHRTMASSSSSSSTSALPSDRRPIVIAGPSGVGKGTLYKLLFERHPGSFALSISHTTRSPRPGEQDGVDYYYVTKDAFKELIVQDKFVERFVFPPSSSFLSLFSSLCSFRIRSTFCMPADIYIYTDTYQ